MLENYSVIMGLSSIVCGLCVISSANAVDCVLFLILVFINGAGIVYSFEAEFIGLIFLIIYVGAIAVLFLFVVMMLEVKNTSEKGYNRSQYIPIGLVCVGSVWSLVVGSESGIGMLRGWGYNWYTNSDNLTQLEVIGQNLYNEYVMCFLCSGILLLIAMVGAIVLTRGVNKCEGKDRVLGRSSFGGYFG
jgi:NADH-quinone oxidoreductase subunit J